MNGCTRGTENGPVTGQLAQAIRKTNPDMFFSISLHTVAYWFPAAYMQYVDYFTFQNYGPDPLT